MKRKREANKVDLSGDQLYELERLWFYYGNSGPKSTPGNHRFIQSLYEQELDLRLMRNKASSPTPECEAAVEKILSGQFSTDHLSEMELTLRNHDIINILAVRGDYAMPSTSEKGSKK